MSVQPETHGAKVRLPPPLAFAGFIVAGIALHYGMFRLPVPLDSVPRSLAGALVLLAGLALGTTTIVMFRRSGQDPRPWTPSPSLLRRGPYKFSRNPMYLSAMLVQAGLGLLLNNLWIVLFVLPAMIIVHVTAVLPEEAYLGEKFGASYQAYKATVRRYL